MPAFNCEPYISAALSSIFSQGVEDIEVVVVDDGSTDRTADIAAAHDPRVKVIKASKMGPAGARNLAVANSTGAYLAFLDADDIWLPGKLQAQMRFFEEHPDARIVYAGHIFWHADAQGVFPSPESVSWVSEDGLNPKMTGWIYPEMLLDSQIHIITAVCHRSVFDAVDGFDGTFGKGSDYDFWIKASRLFQAYKLARDGALYRIHAGGISMRKAAVCAQYEIVNRAITLFGYDGPDGRQSDKAKIRSRLADVCFGHAHSQFYGGNASVAADFFGKAIHLGKHGLKPYGYWIAAKLKALVA
jgi:glycosyltransferase involved in cell wall biosynthesis